MCAAAVAVPTSTAARTVYALPKISAVLETSISHFSARNLWQNGARDSKQQKLVQNTEASTFYPALEPGQIVQRSSTVTSALRHARTNQQWESGTQVGSYDLALAWARNDTPQQERIACQKSAASNGKQEQLPPKPLVFDWLSWLHSCESLFQR